MRATGTPAWLLATAATCFAAAGLASLLLNTGLLNLALLAVALVVSATITLGSAFPMLDKLARLLSSLRWWHYLWLAMYVSSWSFRERDASEIIEGKLDIWVFWRLGWMALVACVLLARESTAGTLTRGKLWVGIPGLLAVHCVFGTLSAAWSVYAPWTLYKSLEFLTDVALITTIVFAEKSALGMKRLFDWTWLLISCLAATVVLGMLIAPSETIHYGIGLIGIRIQGIFPYVSENSVGDLGATLAIVAWARLWSTGRRRWPYAGVFMVSASLLVLAQSRSPLAGLIAAMPFVLVARRKYAALALLTAGLLALLAVAEARDRVWQFLVRNENEELLLSLTGRTDWWQVGWQAFLQQPWIGYGAYAGSRFTILPDLGIGTTSSIHNAWLEILLGTGILGTIPVAAAFVATWLVLLLGLIRTQPNSLQRSLTIEIAAVAILDSIRNFFSVGLTYHPSILFLLAVGYATYLLQSGAIARRNAAPAPWYLPLAIRFDRPVAARSPATGSQSSTLIVLPRSMP